MAISFRIASETLTLPRDSVDKYPGSLLHAAGSSAEDVPHQGDAAVHKVMCPPGSPFTTWPDAIKVAAELYRHDKLPLHTVLDLLDKYPAADLHDKLSDLLDYLKLPGAVRKWLPAWDEVPALHAHVTDLLYAAAVDTAVTNMLSSTAYSSYSICNNIGKQRAAFFYVTEGSRSTADSAGLRVFAVGGAELGRCKPSGLRRIVECAASYRACLPLKAAGSSSSSACLVTSRAALLPQQALMSFERLAGWWATAVAEPGPICLVLLVLTACFGILLIFLACIKSMWAPVLLGAAVGGCTLLW